MRALPHVPARVPGERRHPQVDGRGESNVRAHEWIAAARPAIGADRLARGARRAAAGHRQLGAGQPAGAVVVGKGPGRGART